MQEEAPRVMKAVISPVAEATLTRLKPQQGNEVKGRFDLEVVCYSVEVLREY